MKSWISTFTILTTLSMPLLGYAQSSAKPLSLSDQLEEKARGASKRLPAPMLKIFQQGVETVRTTGIEKSAKQVGDAAVDAELIGWNGETVRLSELWNEGPVVLMWYRGGWCPYCNIQLQAMQKELKKIEGAGAKLVVLTPELPEKAKETAEKNDIDFVALYDKESAVAKKYGLVFKLPETIVPMYRDRIKLGEQNGSDAMELPLSATYVINKEGVITYAFLDADYKKRAEPSEVVEAVQALAGPPKVGSVAPDFELQTPEGNSIKLSQTIQSGPTAIVVLRGYPGYQCGICTRQVGSLISKAKAFAEKETSVLLVYPGPANNLGSKANEFTEGISLPGNFELVIDPDYQFTNQYSLRWDAPRETAYPSTFVVGQDGVIDYAEISKGHGGRSNVQEVLNAIE